MGSDWIVVGVIVAAAAAYIIRRVVRASRGRQVSCGCADSPECTTCRARLQEGPTDPACPSGPTAGR